MARTAEERKEDQRLCTMAFAVNRAMARGVSVVLSDRPGNLLAEGQIVRKERDDQYGLLVFVEDHPNPIPLPFIKTMKLSTKE